MRLFLGTDLPDDVKSHLVRAQHQWHDHVHADGRSPAWVKPANFHLTLKFLGEVDPDRADRLVTSLRTLVSPGPFTLRTGRVQYFPPRGPIRIVSVELDGDTGRLHELANAIESVGEDNGFPRERRPFNPHITIGRSRDGLPCHLRTRHASHLDQPWPEPSNPFSVDQVVLYQSHLKPTGPEYVAVATFPL